MGSALFYSALPLGINSTYWCNKTKEILTEESNQRNRKIKTNSIILVRFDLVLFVVSDGRAPLCERCIELELLCTMSFGQTMVTWNCLRILAYYSLSVLNFEIERRTAYLDYVYRDAADGPLWNDTAYRFNQSVATRAHPNYVLPPPPTSDRSIILLNTQNRVDGYMKWSLNNVSFNLPHTPYLIIVKENLRHVFDQRPAPETYDYRNYDIYAEPKNPNATTGTSIYRLGFNTTVDVILQNAKMLGNSTSETYPWHLHGHDFWVLAHGDENFDPERDLRRYNLVDPIMKNTVAVHPFGWTALQFRADNPGVWPFHCHIESHFFMGMGVVFAEGVDRVGKLPSSIMGCGESKGFGRP
ncbi:hypothetical protein Cni_G22699 [Canna indica]|uniref:Plastocyanin-like domain-containing protein n=1 Tax=Canna indica TaxID=4628 RepID=A0AAQ3QJT2_9LILI|nr:hypothetical protein Cni_G22699 [Canna indica]